MININYMRSYITDVYPTKDWEKKVSYMRDDQIIAIYYSILERKKKLLLEERQRNTRKKISSPRKKEDTHQVTLQEYFYKEKF